MATRERAPTYDKEGPPPRRRWCIGGHVVPADCFWEECYECGNCRADLPPHVDVNVKGPSGASFEDRRRDKIWVNLIRPGNESHEYPPVFGRQEEN